MKRPFIAAVLLIVSICAAQAFGLGKLGANFGHLGALGGAGSPAPARWTPLNLGSSLVAWWDAQDTANIALSGSNVITWTDKVSGIVAPATAVTWSATARNGKPGLIFDGTSSFLSFTPTGFPTGDAISNLFVGAFSNTQSTGYAIIYGSVAANALRSIIIYTGTTPIGYNGSLITSSAASVANQDYSFGYELGAGSASVILNGNTAVVGTPATQSTTASNGLIGTDGSGFYSGVIKQTIVTTALTSSQQAKLAGWESWYDGLAGSNLPIGSPYKSRPPYVSDP